MTKTTKTKTMKIEYWTQRRGSDFVCGGCKKSVLGGELFRRTTILNNCTVWHELFCSVRCRDNHPIKIGQTVRLLSRIEPGTVIEWVNVPEKGCTYAAVPKEDAPGQSAPPRGQRARDVAGLRSWGFTAPGKEWANIADRIVADGEDIDRLKGTVKTSQERESRLRAELAELEKQLPEGMKRCSIRFIQCPIGHSRLIATNWQDDGCPDCRGNHLHAKNVELSNENKILASANHRLRAEVASRRADADASDLSVIHEIPDGSFVRTPGPPGKAGLWFKFADGKLVRSAGDFMVDIVES